MNREVELSTAQAQGYSGFSAGTSQGASPVIPTATQTQSSQPPADSAATYEEGAASDIHEGHLMEKRISALTEPDGNIYRGWAIGFHKGGRVMCLTILVMVIQIFGPIFMLFWANREAKKFDFLTIWQYENQFQNKTKVNPDPFYSWLIPESWASSHWWTANELNEVWQVKILGCLFMIILFFSNDSALLRADIQTDKLRRYWDYEKYEKRKREGEDQGEGLSSLGAWLGVDSKRGWMWIDAVVNSWATVLTGVAALPLFLVSTGIKALILDAFGLLFLAGLDDYGGDVEYGVEDDDWNDIVAEKKEEWREEKATDHLDEETQERWFKNPTYEVGTQHSVFEKQYVSDPDIIPCGLERGVDGSLRCTKFDSSVHSRPMWTKVNKDDINDINCDTNKLYTTAEKKERLEEERDLEQAKLWRNLEGLEARYDRLKQAKENDEEIELHAEDGPLYQPWRRGKNYRPWTVEEQARAWRWHPDIDHPDKDDILPRYDPKLSPEALEDDHFLWTRCHSGDFVYMIARAINYVSICMALPIYVIFHLEEKEENTGEGKTPKRFWPMVFETRYYWLPAGGFIMLVAWLPDLISYFWNYYRTSSLPWHKDYYAPRTTGGRDFTSFFYLVCLRRPDPRFRVDRLD